MRYKNIAAVVAADTTLCFRLRPRVVQLTPKAFQLQSRTRAISTTTSRLITCTTFRPAEHAGPTVPEAISLDTNHDFERHPAGQGEGDGISKEATLAGEVSATETSPVRKNMFINLMRTVPHPVVVITARKQDVEDDLQGTVAATVSSFNTVSIDSELVISFNLKADSTTYQTILESGHFTVTFPQTNIAGANLVNSFTKGNHPSPFDTVYSDHPTPKTYQWLTEDRPSRSTLRYPPPTVALADYHNNKESGFAFAFLCRYETSAHVGDHVIVTGCLTPDLMQVSELGWGAMTRQNAFSSSNVTLAYVHGTYSNADAGLGFANLHKLDDTKAGGVRTHAGPSQRIKQCKKMLATIRSAILFQKNVDARGWYSENVKKPSMKLSRAIALSPELLEKYEWYYVQRLKFWERTLAKENASQQPSILVSDAGQDAKSLPQGTSSTLHFEQIEGYKQLFVRNKELLSQEELSEEIMLYEMRLVKLYLKNLEGDEGTLLEEDAEQEKTSEERQGTTATVPDEDENSRDDLLIQHFEERIQLLKLAKTRKSEIHKPTKALQPSSQTVQPEVSTAVMRRFIGANKNSPLAQLKNKYRRYQTQITEACVALLGLEQLAEGHPDIKPLKERIAFFESRLQVTAQILQERARSLSASLVLDNFKPPRLQKEDQDDISKANAAGDRRPINTARTLEAGDARAKQVERTPNVTNIRYKKTTGPPIKRLEMSQESHPDRLESFDQLDSTEGVPIGDEPTGVVVKRVLDKLPVKRKRMESRQDDALSGLSDQYEDEGEALTDAEVLERDLLRQNASEVRDYLVMQSTEGEETPSPDDLVDVNKLRLERLRKLEQKNKE